MAAVPVEVVEEAVAPEGVKQNAVNPASGDPPRKASRCKDGGRVLIIAPHGSYRTAPFIRAAENLGLPVLVASQGRHSIVSAYANGLHIDFHDPDAALATILAEARRQPFSAVIGTDDSSTELATRVCALLNLPHNPIAAVQLARRKDLARKRLSEQHVQVPEHRLLDLRCNLLEQVDGFRFPGVIKPLVLSASRGVIRVNDPAELQTAAQRIHAMLLLEPGLQDAETHQLLLESFIAGQEVAVEAILYAGRLELLAVFNKPEEMNGPFFEETFYVTPSGLDSTTLENLRDTLAASCAAYGLREGPVHAECRINAAGVWVIEIAARTIGGLCARLLHFGTGRTLEELVLEHAMGRRQPVESGKDAAGVLMIPIPRAGVLKRVEGLLKARRVKFIEEIDIQIREGHQVVPLPEGSSYLGFVFSRAPHPEQVYLALQQAYACLNIVVAPLWTVQARQAG